MMATSASDRVRGEIGDFATTRWSVVLAAGGTASGAQEALARLCEAYWYPLYVYVRSQGSGPEDAADLTQEFFARLLAKGWLENVARERGRFRSWLLVAAKHFLANERARARTIKRGGRVKFVSFDEQTAEARYASEAADGSVPDRIYDRRWARTALERALERLRQEMIISGKETHFEALKGALTGRGRAHAEIADGLGVSAGAVKVAAHRFRERFRGILRSEIADTVADPSEINAELRHLLTSLCE